MLFNALQAVLMVIVIVALGFFAGYKGWAGHEVTNFITRLIINITLPCTVLNSFLNSLSAEEVKSSWVYIVAAFASMVVIYLLSKLVARLARIEEGKRGVFSVLFTLSNSVFMGLPVAVAIFGDDGLLFALFYFVANTTFMNSIGYLEVARDGMVLAGTRVKTSAGSILKKLFQPPLIAVIAGFILVLSQAELPAFLTSAFMYTGNITSPLALIFLGIVLQREGLSSVRRIDKGISLALLGRFIIAPLTMLLVAKLFGLSDFATGIFVVQTGLPAMVTASIFAEATGADTDFAARGVVISTLFSFISIPIYVAILG